MRNRALEPLEPRRLLTLAIDYPMEEGSGRAVADIAPLYGQQDATLLGGAQWTPTDGKVLSSTRAISLNGVYASILTEEFKWMIAENATVSAWIKTTDVGGVDPASSPGLLGAVGGGRGIAWGWIDNCGRINFTVPGPTPLNGRDTVTSDFPINDGTWYHVLMTRDVTAGEIKLYVNGLLQDHALADPTIRSGIAIREIGLLEDPSGQSPPRYLNASIDKFHVYDEALTDDQIAHDFDPQGAEPAAPTNLGLILPGSRVITLTWDHVPGASGYEIWRSYAGAGAFEKVALAPPTGRFTDTGLDPQTGYEYRIRAVNPFGTSDFSPTVSGQTIWVQWDPPVLIEGSEGDDTIRVEVRGPEVHIWNSAAPFSCTCDAPYRVVPLAEHSGIVVAGLGGSDNILVDVAADAHVFDQVTVNGGAGNDDVRVSGKTSFLVRGGADHDELRVSGRGSFTVGADTGLDDLTMGDSAVVTLLHDEQFGSWVFDSAATLGFYPPTTVRTITPHADARIEIGSGTLRLLDSPERDVMIRRLETMAATARAATPPWSGPRGLTSSAVKSPLMGIAVSTETKVTWNGDANLDGRITSDDYFAIDAGFLAQPADPLYTQGDFNYDGNITSDDYFLIDQAFLGQTTPIPTATNTTAATAPTAVTPFSRQRINRPTRPRRASTLAAEDQDLLVASALLFP